MLSSLYFIWADRASNLAESFHEKQQEILVRSQQSSNGKINKQTMDTIMSRFSPRTSEAWTERESDVTFLDLLFYII